MTPKGLFGAIAPTRLTGHGVVRGRSMLEEVMPLHGALTTGGHVALEVKLWKVEDDRLAAVEAERLDLEDRLENWLCEDIGVLSQDLLVIGR